MKTKLHCSKLLCFIFVQLLFNSANSFAQLSGSYSIPGDYSTIADAVGALNTQGISGSVIFNVTQGHTETLASAITCTVTGTPSNTIVFQKSGSGPNPIITAFTGTNTPGSVVHDDIWRFVGSDYITVNGIDLVDPNTSNPSTMESGYVFYKASASDGCQNNTIKNCNITLKRTNNATGSGPSVEGSRAIELTNALYTAATTAVTPSSATGANSNNLFYSNVIQNCNYGIVLSGFASTSPFTTGDTGNDIGGNSGSTGNSILNFGGGAATNPAAGIRANNQWGLNISYNTINNNNGGGVNHATTLRGIYAQAGTSANITIESNTVTVKSAATTSAIVAIENAIGSTAASNTVNIINNTITGCTYTSATTGTFTGILNTASAANVNITGNALSSNSTNATSGTTNLIFNNAAVATALNINFNTINGWTFNAANSGTLNAINTNGTAAAAVSISNNEFINITHAVLGSSSHFYISSSNASSPTTNINDNKFTNLSVNTSGGVSFIFKSGSMTSTGSENVQGNLIVTGFSKLAGGGTVNFYSSANSSVNGATQIHSGNNFSNVSLTGGTVLNGWNNIDGLSSSSGPTKTISNNTFSSISGGTAAMTLMNIGFSGANSLISSNTINTISGGASITGINSGSSNQSITVSQNSITNMSSTGATAFLTGIQYGSPAAGEIIRNKVCDIQANASGGSVAGISVTAGTTVNVRNNIVGELRAPLANAANPIVGINIGGLAALTTNVFFNTVRLNATSTGATFGSSAISTGVASTVNFLYNIFVNSSTSNGSGLSVAYRRSSSIFTTYASTSDRNLFYAPIIFYDGTPRITLSDYKLFASTKDQNSITEAPPFLSTSCGDATFLHINPLVQTGIESGALPIAGITTDFDGDNRNATTPDIGADEINGLPFTQCSGTPTEGSISGISPICVGTGTLLTLNGATLDVNTTYRWYSGTTPGGPYPNVLGSALTQATGILSVTTYFIVVVTCTNSALSSTTTEKIVVVNPLPNVTVTPPSSLFCLPGTGVTLTADGASTYTWSPTSGLIPTSGSPVVASPTSSTIYTVTGTDANGCTNTATSNISVASALTLCDISASPSILCDGGSTTLNASVGFANTPTYCASIHALGCNIGDEIQRVQLNTLDNSSGCSVGAYTYYNGGGPQTTTLLAGSFYILTVRVGSDNTQYASAWIDYNQDGSFSSTDEYLGISFFGGSNSILNIPFSVPSTLVYNCKTRLRIIGGNDFPILNSQSCGASSHGFGETEDYDINIIGGTNNPAIISQWTENPSLGTITNPNVSQTTATGITSTTQYTYTGTSSSGCTVVGSVNVTVVPTPVANAGSDITICAGECATLTAATALGAISYEWFSLPNLISQSTSTIASVCPTVTTCYLLVVSGGSNCSDSDTVCVNVSSMAASWPVVYDVICSGDGPLQLSGATPLGGTYSGFGVDAAGVFHPMHPASLGLQPLYYVYFDTCTQQNDTLFNSILVINCPCDTSLCRDFNDNNLRGWIPNPTAPNVAVTLSNTNSQNGTGDYYASVLDIEGPSEVKTGTDFVGRWCCGEFCYDVKIFNDADNTAVLSAQPVMYIKRGSKGFKYTSNTYITENSGWFRVCAPITNCNPMPLSATGVWEPLPGTNAIDWDPVTNHIDAISFLSDQFGNAGEVRGFDNVCFNSTGVNITLNRIDCDTIQAEVSSCCGPYTYTWSGGTQVNDSTITDLLGGTTYTLTVSNILGESSTSTITVDVLTVNAGPDQVICYNGGTATLQGSTNISGAPFMWSSLSTGVISAGQGTATPTVSGADCYVLTIIDPVTGCVARDTICITVSILTLTGTSTNIPCRESNTGSISGILTGSSSPTTIVIDPPVSSSVAGPNFTFSNLPTGPYNIIATDVNGCTTQQSFVISQDSCPCDTCYSLYDKNWHFGFNSSLSFPASGPPVVGGSSIQTAAGCATISDDCGALLFYTDGVKVWNKNGVQMSNGFGLFGHTGSSQSALIVQKPGSANLYYIFTSAIVAATGINYSVVDMSLNSGLGDVTTKNTPLLANATEKLAAVANKNGTGIWVITHEFGNNNFKAFLFTASGLSNTVTSSIGINHAGSVLQRIGSMKISPDGTKLAVAMYHTENKVEVLSFDNTTGSVTGSLKIYQLTLANDNPHGVSFSPNGKLLYVACWSLSGVQGHVYQYDLADVTNTPFSVATGSATATFGTMLLGPDNKIYLSRYSSSILKVLDVINDPDIIGSGCNYVASQVNLSPGQSKGSLPNFVEGVDLGVSLSSDLTICSGETAILTSSGCAHNLSWYQINGMTATPLPFTSTEISVTPTANATYVVQCCDSFGCCSDTLSVFVISCNDTCHANSIALNTGFDHDLNVVLNAPQRDRFWKLISVPSGPLTVPIDAFTVQRATDWVSIGNSKWVGANPDAASDTGAAPGWYKFEYRFCLEDLLGNPSLNLNIVADNSANVYLNNQQIGSVSSYTTALNIVNSAFLISGINKIRVEVFNDWQVNNPSGFDISGTVTTTNNALGRLGCCCDSAELTWPIVYDVICGGDAPLQLSGATPLGGTYHGPGVDASGVFHPTYPGGLGVQTLYYTFYDTCYQRIDTVYNSIEVINCPCDTGLCRDFNDNNLHGWIPNPTAPNVAVTLSNTNSQNGTGDYYASVLDIEGPSEVKTGMDFVGRWCCGEFCYDVKIFNDADNTAVLSAQPVMYIKRGTKGFKYTSNTYITENSGWFRVCAPITNCNPMPLSATGVWEPLPGTNAIDWDHVTNHIDAISFLSDQFGNAGEVRGFDNVCFNSNPLSVTLTRSGCDTIYANATGCCDPFNYSWSAGTVIGTYGNVITGLVAGTTYTVTVTNSIGESAIATLTIDGLIANAGPDQVICDAGSQIVFQGSTNVSGATLTWSVVSSGSILSGQGSTSPTVVGVDCYVLTVFDPVTGCTATDTVCVSISPMILSGTSVNIPCKETNTGSITGTITGGTLPVTIAIDPPVSASVTGPNFSFANLAIGSYNVIATDLNGCTTQQTFIIEKDTCPCDTCYSSFNKNWHFGFNSSLSFPTNGPPVVGSSSIHTQEGCATISDDCGDLLFYTDGIHVWNKTGTQMSNGFGLLGNNGSSQSALIVPKPGSSKLYYIFTADAVSAAGINYSVVDMSLNGGLGDVTTKNTLLLSSATEKLAAVANKNGTGVWVIAHEFGNNNYKAFLFTSSGLSNTVTSSIGISHSGNTSHGIGCMKFSPDGTKLAAAIYTNEDKVEVFSFDNSTGSVTGNLKLYQLGQPNDNPYGISFSPDGKLLYVSCWSSSNSNGHVYQYNLADPTNTAFSVASGNSTTTFGAIQLGPDNKIYVSRFSTPTPVSVLDVINNPDVIGSGCNYFASQVNLSPGKSQGGLPNFVEGLDRSVTVSQDMTICSGQTAILKASGCAHNLSWYKIVGNVSTLLPLTDAEISVSPIINTCYVASCCDSLGCCSDTVCITVTSMTLSGTSTDILCRERNTGSITGTLVGGIAPTTITINPPVSASITGSTFSYSNLAVGTYTIIATDVNGCTTQQSFIINQDTCPCDTCYSAFNKNWHFGYNSSLSFPVGGPPVVGGSSIQTVEGCATISDDCGVLLFYTDGIKVWNKNGAQMSNGFGLLGNAGSSQSALIVPKPGSSKLYYIFTAAAVSAAGINYSIVDMSLNGGLGDVTTKNTQLLASATEKLAAVANKNGTGVWVIAHEYDNANYKSFLFTSSGLSNTVTSSVGISHTGNTSSGIGCLKVSPDGIKLAAAIYDPNNKVEVLSFDNSTGSVTGSLKLYSLTQTYDNPYGISFSPDGKLLYVSCWSNGNVQGHIYQYNLASTNNTPYSVSAGNATTTFGAIQLGPDNKIYVSRYSSSVVSVLDVINNPDVIGSGCTYTASQVNLSPGMSKGSLPNFVEGFDRSVTVSPNVTICSGQSTTLKASGCAHNLSWYEVVGNVSTLLPLTDAEISVSPIINTCYVASCCDSLGCCSDTVCVTVVSNPASWPTVYDVICSVDGPLQLSGATPPGGTYSGFGVDAAGVFHPASLGLQPLYYIYFDTCSQQNDTLLNSILVIDCPCDTTLCRDFNDNNLHGWIPNPTAPNVAVSLSNTGSQQGGGDYYVSSLDLVGPSEVKTGNDFVGRWCCGEFCYDVKIFNDADVNSVLSTRPIMYIKRGTKGFKYTSNTYITENSGWFRVCAPITNCNPMPTSTTGVWEPLPGTNASDWGSVTNHIDAISFLADQFGIAGEVWGFDNACFNSTGVSVTLNRLDCDTIQAQVTSCCGPYTYVWSGGTQINDSTIKNLVGGTTYTLTVTNALGESTTASINVDAVVANAGPDQSSCNPGDCKTLSAQSALPNITYTWFVLGNSSSLGAGSTISQCPTSTTCYLLIASDAYGCSDSDTVCINVSSLDIIATKTDVLCNGESTGSINGNATGAIGAYSISISPDPALQSPVSSANFDFTLLPAGVYTITVTDGNGCSYSESFTISQPPPLNVNVTPPSVLCIGQQKQINITVAGGTPGYIYDITGGTSGTLALAGTITTTDFYSAGTYTIIVSDGNGCEAQQQFTLNAINCIDTCQLDTFKINTAYNRVTDDTLLTNARDPFWKVISTPSGVLPVPQDAIVQTRNGGWVRMDKSKYIGNIPNSNNGAPIGNYVYEFYFCLTDLNQVSLLVNLLADNRAAVLLNGTQILTTVPAVPVGSGPQPFRVVADTIVYGPFVLGRNVIRVNLVNDGGPSGLDITGYVTSGHSAIGYPGCCCPGPLPLVNAGADQINCENFMQDTLSGSTNVSGANVSWTALGTGQIISGGNSLQAIVSGADCYVLTVTNPITGCTNTDTVCVTVNPILVTATIVDVLCNGGMTGRIWGEIQGGIPQYTAVINPDPYNVSPIAGPNFSFDNLPAGNYTITGVDGNSCTNAQTFTVSEPPPLVVSVTQTTNICISQQTTIDISVSGGTPGYSYLISPGNTSGVISTAGSNTTTVQYSIGSYSITLTDTNGCISTVAFNISATTCCDSLLTDSLILSTGYDHISNSTYATDVSDGGWAVVHATPDITVAKPYSAWTIEKHPSWPNALGNGQWISAYNHYRDEYSNPLPDSAYEFEYCFCLCQPDTVKFDFYALADDYAEFYLQEDPGNIFGTVSSWSTPNHIQYQKYLDAGPHCIRAAVRNLYSVAMGISISGTVKSDYLLKWEGCDGVKPIVAGPIDLNVANQPQLGIAVINNSTCAGANNGSITVPVFGGTPPYAYLWSNAVTTPSNVGLAPGNYTLTVTDSLGNVVTSPAYLIQENPPIIISVDSVHQVTCYGGEDGYLNFSASGGTGVLTYNVERVNGFGCCASGNCGRNPNFSCQSCQCISNVPGAYSDLDASLYVITVIDANGCSATSSITLTQPSALTVSTTTTNVGCSGPPNGSATAIITGGTASYGIDWRFDSLFTSLGTTPTISNLIVSDYVVTVTDANGCTASASATVEQQVGPAQPSVISGPTVVSPFAMGVVYAIAPVIDASSYLWTVPSGSTIVSGQGTTSITVNFGNTDGDIGVIAMNDCGASAASLLSIQVNQQATVDLKVYIEGYYLGSGMMASVIDNVNYPLNCDTLILHLADTTSFTIMHSDTAIMQTNGDVQFHFPMSAVGSYYLIVQHRNALETWSAAPVAITANTSYDFTTAITQAYGNRLHTLPDGNFAIISGDVNKDGEIDEVDFQMIESASQLFMIGYESPDLTGDNCVESADYSLIENNSILNIIVGRP